MIEITKMQEEDLNNDFVETMSSLRTMENSLLEMKITFISRRWRGVETFVAKNDGRIVGTGSIFIEPKYYGNAAHIEDVVVHKDFQKQGIGRQIIQHLEEEAKVHECYKIVLDCSETNVAFYESLGYIKRETQMRKDL